MTASPTPPALLRFDANLGWLFTELPFERRFEAAAQAGFTAVEYASPYEYTSDFLRKCLNDAGLEQILINTPAGAPGSATSYGAACLPDRVGEFRDGLLRALEYAVALDAGVIHVLGGIRPAGVAHEYALATYVANVGWAVEQVASTGVTLALEAINQRDAPGFVLRSIEDAASVVRALGAGNLGLLFDLYHCQITDGDLAVRLTELMPITAHIQIAEPPARAEPGTGEIAWGFIFEHIRSLGYDRWIGCEYRPAAGTLEGLGWRDRFGVAAGPGLRGAGARRVSERP